MKHLTGIFSTPASSVPLVRVNVCYDGGHEGSLSEVDLVIKMPL